MTSKHPHYDTIVAWAEGKTVQVWCNVGHYWYDWADNYAPAFDLDNRYRVKPETIRYRVFLLRWRNSMPSISVVDEQSQKEEPREEWGSFVRWLGDWQEVEI